LESQSVPEFLFRYRSDDTPYFWDELEKAVESRQFYFASAERLNDPFEIKPSIARPSSEVFLNILKAKYGKNPVISRKTIEKVHGEKLSRQTHRKKLKDFAPSIDVAKWMLEQMEQTFTKLNSSTRVVCFNETSMSLPMWAHYANNHQGVCLSFELNPQEHTKPDFAPLRVSYSSERPILDIGEFVSANMDQKGFSAADEMRFVSATYLTKSSDWSYEREWRAFDNGGRVAGYERMSVLKPYSIILGMNVSKSLKDQVIEKFGRQLRLLESQPVRDKYALAFKELN
jgi:hypothetical protein